MAGQDQRESLPATIDRFEVRGLAGSGGMAKIYSAWDAEHERREADRDPPGPRVHDAGPGHLVRQPDGDERGAAQEQERRALHLGVESVDESRGARLVETLRSPASAGARVEPDQRAPFEPRLREEAGSDLVAGRGPDTEGRAGVRQSGWC